MAATVIKLSERRAPLVNSRLLVAARNALAVLDTMSLDELAAGGDSQVRAELVAAIRDAETMEKGNG